MTAPSNGWSRWDCAFGTRSTSSAAGEAVRADDTIDRAVSELAIAIDELRELAHGLPPTQLDTGLDPALRELAVRAPLPVQVHATPERFSVGLEAAAYFVACEGLTNAIKHSDATEVVLSAQRSNGHLIVEVTDDGGGGAVDKLGGGLRGCMTGSRRMAAACVSRVRRTEARS